MSATKLRLGLVGPLPPPEGGMANQTRQLAQLLGKEGLDVRVTRTNGPCRPAWLDRIRGVRGLARLAELRLQLRSLTAHSQVMHVMANSGWAWFLCAAPAIRAATKRNLPVVVNYRGGLAREFLAESSGRVLPVLRQAHAVIVPSRFLQEVFAGYGIRADIIPNIVNREVFKPVARPDGGRHVVITRNLEHIYGIDIAIKALARVHAEFPDLTVSIAGAGPDRAQLEALVATLQLTNVVRFTGRLDVNSVAQLYGQADIVLNSSRVDNTPNALLEAASCGVPIVSTQVGGVGFLLEHGRTAWLVPPESPEKLAEGLSHVLRDAPLRATLRANALQLAHACSWDVVKNQWLQLYDELARGATKKLQPVSQS
jgi:glycosyltransferase involved in cell wall biosynthesis